MAAIGDAERETGHYRIGVVDPLPRRRGFARSDEPIGEIYFPHRLLLARGNIWATSGQHRGNIIFGFAVFLHFPRDYSY
jgi:hypothetical protein